MHPSDADGVREAWAVLERLWPQTVDRARGFPPEALHERVDGEWSFIETLRHLAFATDAWVSRAMLGDPSPWDALDLPHDEMPDEPSVPRDREARPSLDEVLALRADRMATVRRVVTDLTDDQLDGMTARGPRTRLPRAGELPRTPLPAGHPRRGVAAPDLRRARPRCPGGSSHRKLIGVPGCPSAYRERAMRLLKNLPREDPGTPDLSGVWPFLSWIARQQWRTLAWGITWGIVWMLAAAAVPVGLGRGITAISDDDLQGVALWSAVVLLLGIVSAVSGILRHQMAVANWIGAASRIQQLVARQAADLGGDLPKQVATGEVVAVSASDVERIGSAFDVTARMAGAIVSYVAVAIVMVFVSPVLGAVVIVGVPLTALAIAPLVKPLERRESAQRARFGETTELAADTVAGLRVLRGIGGEDLFLQRFNDKSGEVRQAAVGTAKIRSMLDAFQVALPGAFLVAVTWLGAQLALSGDLTAGQLVTFYGFAAFLVLPAANRDRDGAQVDLGTGRRPTGHRRALPAATAPRLHRPGQRARLG